MEGAVKWLLIIGGGFLAYEALKGSSAGTAPAAAGGTGTGAGSSAPPAPPAVNTSALKGALAAYIATQYPAGQIPATFTGYQWNYYAQRAFGAAYVDPHPVGVNSYTLDQYIAVYAGGPGASAGMPPTVPTAGGAGMTGFGVFQLSRDQRDKLIRAGKSGYHRATHPPVLKLSLVSRRRIADKNYWGDSMRSSRQVPYSWVQ